MSASGAGLPPAMIPRDAGAAALRPGLGPSPDVLTLLAELQAWAEAGWLRRLDIAFARFVLELCPDAGAPVVLAAALTERKGRATPACSSRTCCTTPKPCSAGRRRRRRRYGR